LPVAIPSLAAQGIFELAECVIIPRGLRLDPAR